MGWRFRGLTSHAGEGGSFALYQGLYPREDVDVDADRTLTGETLNGQENQKPRTLKEKARWPLLLWVCLRFFFLR